jgi:hypothetical protein
MLMAPVDVLKHDTLVSEAKVTDKAAAGWEMTNGGVEVSWHRFESRMLTLYEPAGTLLKFCVVALLLHKNVYGGVPPEGEI